MKIRFIFKLIVSVALPVALGAIAGIVTSREIAGWYASLNKPSFNPPNWIFGPVWTALYILMGISFFIIWQLKPSKERNNALFIYYIQLALNFAWSFVFFYFKQTGFAFTNIIALWISIVIMMVLFYKLKPAAAYLNIPYLLWVSFATALNASIFYLN